MISANVVSLQYALQDHRYLLHLLDFGLDHQRSGCNHRTAQLLFAAQPPIAPARSASAETPAIRCQRMERWAGKLSLLMARSLQPRFSRELSAP
jgi:hypothetical protein